MTYFIKLKSGDRPTILSNTGNGGSTARYFQPVVAFDKASEATSEYDNIRFERISRKEVEARYGKDFEIVDGQVLTAAQACNAQF